MWFCCKILDCQSISHFDVIHKLHDDLITANIEASEVIPNTTVSKVNTIPGWDSLVSCKIVLMVHLVTLILQTCCLTNILYGCCT